MTTSPPFRAGFVNILGLPNVGKSSLINFLIDEKLSIVNSKSQTTRQNIKGFVNGEHYQLIIVDTPGFIDEPAYQLQLNMNSYIDLALEESDIILFVVDKYNILDETHPLVHAIKFSKKKTILVINKMDQTTPEEATMLMNHYSQVLELIEKTFVSVESRIGKAGLMDLIVSHLPEHDAYYDREEWTDRNMRFFVAETIREKIFSTYQKEIPYSSEVIVNKYIDREDNSLIEATIYVERDSQKKIIIGHNAEKLKKISIEARREIESYADTKVHLFIFVKVLEDWRNKEKLLERFGYFSPKSKK